MIKSHFCAGIKILLFEGLVVPKGKGWYVLGTRVQTDLKKRNKFPGGTDKEYPGELIPKTLRREMKEEAGPNFTIFDNEEIIVDEAYVGPWHTQYYFYLKGDIEYLPFDKQWVFEEHDEKGRFIGLMETEWIPFGEFISKCENKRHLHALGEAYKKVFRNSKEFCYDNWEDILLLP